MNIIPFILLLSVLSGDKFSSVKELLQKIDFPSFEPVMKLLKMDDKTIEFIKSADFENLLGGEFDLKNLIPLISSLINNKATVGTGTDDGKEDMKTYYLSPIKNVASTEIETTLGLYFS